MATRKAPAQDTTNLDTQAQQQQPTAEPATLPAPQAAQPQEQQPTTEARPEAKPHTPTVYLPYQP